MKNAADEAKNAFVDMTFMCQKDQEILHIMHLGKQIALEKPTFAEHLRCLTCNGNQGFYIPHLKTWSCLNKACTQLNAGKHIPLEKKELEVKRECYIDKCNQPIETIEYLKKFASNPFGFIVLVGENGRGKTFAAEAVYQDFVCSSWEKKFITQSELNTLWEEEKKKYGSHSDLVTRFSDYKLLILDDIGTRKPSESFMDFLYVLVDNRYRSKRGTIVTTNKTALEIRELFGDAFLSRVASGKNIRVEGPIDRRMNTF